MFTMFNGLSSLERVVILTCILVQAELDVRRAAGAAECPDIVVTHGASRQDSFSATLKPQLDRAISEIMFYKEQVKVADERLRSGLH